MPRVVIESCRELSHRAWAPGLEPSCYHNFCQFLLNAVTLTWWCYRHLLSQVDQSGAAHPWLDWVIRLLFLSATCYLFLYLLLAVYLINSLTQNKHHCSSRPCSCPHRTPSDARSGTQLPNETESHSEASLAWKLLVWLELAVPTRGNLPALSF